MCSVLHTGWRPHWVAFLAFVVVAANSAATQDANWLPSPPPAAAPKDDGQWVMPSKNYASTHYSELAEVNAGNVDRLQVAFTFSTGVKRGHEAPPLIVGATMYVLSEAAFEFLPAMMDKLVRRCQRDFL